MKLSLGFSPCPNDTFIFDAMIHGKIDTEGLEFDVKLADVEELNQMAFRHDLDITKLSFHAFGHLVDQYVLLNAGSALGRNCGPLLIATKALSAEEVEAGNIAIPGKFTTANFLFSFAFPKALHKKAHLFSDIEPAVLGNQVDAGVIIHENRFTYQEKGLVKIMDLGEHWESQTGHPIPLGGIVVSRNLAPEVQQKVNRVMARSVQYAFDHPDASAEFVAQYAQEMDPAVMKAHINLYVNAFTRNLGTEGRDAVVFLLETAQSNGVIPVFLASPFL